MLFTKRELVKLHRHFHDPSSAKLYGLVKRAKPNQADESTRKLLQEISRSCETCQTFSPPSQRFRVSLLPSDVVFNREVAMELMLIDKKALLHDVDLETNFSSVTFLPTKPWKEFGMHSFRAGHLCTLDFP